LRRELGSPLAAILKIVGAVVVSFALFAAWFYPANAATHGDLYDQMFIHHVIERIERPLENHGGYSPFYLLFYGLVIVASFFPWTLYLPGALAHLIKKDGGRGRVLLLTWIATVLVVMIAISTKLPHYILPIWPALALSVGAYLDAMAADDAPSSGPLWTAFGGVLFLLMALGAAAAIGFGPDYIAKYAKRPDALWLPFANDSRSLRSVLGALCLVIALPLIFRHRAPNFVLNAKLLLLAALLFFILADALILPSFERVKISAVLAQQIHAHVPQDTPVTVSGYNEASLIFYLNHTVDDIVPERSAAQIAAEPKPAARADPQVAAKKVAQALTDWASARGPGVLVIPRTMYEKYSGDAGLAGLVPIANVTGFNYSKGHWVNVLAFRRPN